MSDNWIRKATYVAMCAAVLGAVADLLLLYNPNGGYFDNTYMFLLDISQTRLMAGHFLGIFAIPLEMLGLFQVYRALKPAGTKLAWAVMICTLYLGFPGVVYHGTVAFTGAYLKLMQQAPANFEQMADLWPQVRLLSDVLAAALPAGFFVLSGLLLYTILKKPTLYPRWMAAFTPITFYVIFFLAFFIVKPVGAVLIPAGFNLSFLGFFAVSIYAEGKQT